MNKLSLLGLLFACYLNSFSQDTIYTRAFWPVQPVSYFEDRDSANYFYFDSLQFDNRWQIGTPGKSTFNSSYSAPLALVTDTLLTYPNNNISSFEFVVESDDATVITFWHRFDTDSLSDGCIVEVSFDGGLSWMNIIDTNRFNLINFYSSSSLISSNNSKAGFTGHSGWVQSTISSQYVHFVRFKFTFSSDGINTGKDGWMIDDFNFISIGTGVIELDNNSPVKLYPNPSTDLIQIEIKDDQRLLYSVITDLSGKIIQKAYSRKLDVAALSPGIYIVETFTDQRKYVSRIVR